MHKSAKLLSFFLALLLLAQWIPTQVWAAAAADEPASVSETADAPAEDAEAPAEILGEDEALRSADTKHFYRADGSYMAVNMLRLSIIRRARTHRGRTSTTLLC